MLYILFKPREDRSRSHRLRSIGSTQRASPVILPTTPYLTRRLVAYWFGKVVGFVCTATQIWQPDVTAPVKTLAGHVTLKYWLGTGHTESHDSCIFLFMVMSCYGDVFRITDPLCGKSTGLTFYVSSVFTLTNCWTKIFTSHSIGINYLPWWVQPSFSFRTLKFLLQSIMWTTVDWQKRHVSKWPMWSREIFVD